MAAAVLLSGEKYMSILMAGIDHTRADLDVRSMFSFTNKSIEQAYAFFKETPGLEGCVVISTCNRMEIWLSLADTAVFSPIDLLCGYVGVNTETYAPYFTERRGREAVDHLFRVAAGLESRIVGEDQIITQVGDALAFSRKCYAADHTLEVLFRLAVTAAKRSKTEAGISPGDRSVIRAALGNLSEKGLCVEGKKCMVIGNGMMGRLSAQELMDAGADVTVTVREYRSGVVDIPRGAARIGYKSRYELLPLCDFVVSATTSPNYTLSLEELSPLPVGHPVCLLDLAVPRDIDPRIRELEWAELYDIDDFHIDPMSDQLLAALEKARQILNEEEDRFYSWYEGRDFAAQIQRLKQAAGEDITARMSPFLRRVPLDAEWKNELSRETAGAAARMINHLLFDMRSRLSDDTFRECLDAMEHVMRE